MILSEDFGKLSGISFTFRDRMIQCKKCKDQLWDIAQDREKPVFYCCKCEIFYNGKSELIDLTI